MIKALKEMYTTAQIKPSEIIAPFMKSVRRMNKEKHD